MWPFALREITPPVSEATTVCEALACAVSASMLKSAKT